MAPPTFDLSGDSGLKELDSYLLTRSYVTGYQASRDDLAVYAALASAPDASKYANAARWFKHITSLLGDNFKGESTGVNLGSGAAPAAGPASSPAPAAAAPAPAAAAAAADDDDDDLDLFGEETEEEKAARAKAAEEAAKKKASKPKEIGKSTVVMDVKPWDDETDMAVLEKTVRSIQKEGLIWGASKLVAIGYGIKKLQIMCTIVDDLISMDELIEDDIQEGAAKDFVQSVDIVAFNKV
eukprot:jgi/Chlat1/488/Chrsp103S01089